MTNTCEQRNETSGFIIGTEIINYCNSQDESSPVNGFVQKFVSACFFVNQLYSLLSRIQI
jgi:hypothetical protein